MREQKCASREKTRTTGESVFFISPQSRSTLQENPLAYDGSASGAVYLAGDPIGIAGGTNLYLYGLANPLTYTDPLGLNPLAGAIEGAEVGSAFGPAGTAVGAVVGAIGGAIIANQINSAINNASSSASSNSASSSEECEQECDDALGRDYAYCKALGATYKDYRTRKACEENAFSKYVKCRKKCKDQCK